MPCTMPRSVTLRPSGTFVCAMIPSIDVGDPAEVFVERAHVDIDGAAQLVVIHFGGRFDAVDGADVIEPRGFFGVRRRAAEWTSRSDRLFT